MRFCVYNLVGSYLTLNHYYQLFGTLVNAYHMWHNVPNNWDSVYIILQEVT